MIRKIYFLSGILSIIAMKTFCSDSEHCNYSNLRGNGMQFIENKGQLVDMDNHLRPDILFAGEGGENKFYLRKSGFSLVIAKIDGFEENEKQYIELLKKGPSSVQLDKFTKEQWEHTVLKTERIDINFENCNSNCRVIKEDQVEGYFNYYYPHCPEGITNVRAYNKIIYENIYPHIDIVFYGGKEKGLKYDIVVRSGGNPNDIILKYVGTDGIEIKNGKLKIESQLGEMIEWMPKVYQKVNGKIKDIKCEYKLKDKQTLNFKFQTTDFNIPIIIDPWITCYGGTGDDKSTGICTDAGGNVIITGNTFSTNFPVNPGAFQVSTASGLWGDIFLIKFDVNGNRLWATYCGGTLSDYNGGNGVAIDKATGDIVITGRTTSIDFPVTVGAIQSSLAATGSTDVFIVKFSSSGIRLWATYYGGTARDDDGGISTDAVGNIVITGTTWSSDFPILSAFQATFTGAGFFGNVFVAKFNSSGVPQWSTYYGGSKWDEGKGVSTDGAGNIFVTGNTGSTDFPVSGAFQASLANISWGDAFLIKFDGNGNRQWATYYGGSDDDHSTDICTDTPGNIIITGYTSSSDFPISAGCQQSVYGGGSTVNSDIFILKFNSAGNRSWATYQGTAYGEWNPSCAVDKNNNIFIWGEVEDETTTIIYSCAYQKTFGGGGEDQYITKYTPGGIILCNTYLGGTMEDDLDYAKGGITCFGNYMYVSASTMGSYPTTTGAFQQNSAGGWDVTIAKLCTHSCGDTSRVNIDFSANASQICPGKPVDFTLLANPCDTNEIQYLWAFPGAAIASSTQKNPVGIIYNTAGSYPVKLIMSTPCIKDSITKIAYIKVESPIISVTSQNNVSCNGGNNASISVSANGGSGNISYSWNTGSSANTISNLVAGTYSVTATDINDCSSSDSIIITQPPPISLTVNSIPSDCRNKGGQATVNVSGGAFGYNYLWSTIPTQSTQTATGLTSGNYSVMVTDMNNCTAVTNVTITMMGIPIISISSKTDVSCYGGSNGSATASAIGGTPGYIYLWSNGTTGIGVSNLSNGIYSVTVTDVNGCTATNNVSINQPNALNVNITTNDITCNGGNNGIAAANPNGGIAPYFYYWSNGATNNNVNGLTSGTYTVVVTDANNCNVIATINIAEPLPLVVSFVADDTSGCGPLCINFNNTTANVISYQWYFGDGDSSSAENPKHCYYSPGSYNVTLRVVDTNGCSDIFTQTNMITVHPDPIAEFIMNPQPLTYSSPTVYFTDQSQGAVNWQWSMGDVIGAKSNQRDPHYTYSDTGTYLVQLIVTNGYGCTDTVEKIVYFSGEFTLYVPNSFTPNEDGLNDLFLPEGYGIDADKFEMYIFDRWGNLIYTSTDYQKGWDGRANGGAKTAQQDTYVWIINAKDIFGIKHRLVGKVSLIK